MSNPDTHIQQPSQPSSSQPLQQSQQPLSSGVKPNVLHERHKDENGEWKVEHSYEILNRIGKGGFAKVYLARHIASGEHYAIKVINKSSLEKDSFKDKLNQEIKFQKNLNHENIVRYYSSFEDAKNVYIVLEYCSNQTFKELLDRRKKLTEIEVKSHLLSIISALQYIHSKGIIHRDLKIANIFLNEKMVLKIADFGLSAWLKSPSHRRKTVCGTPNYIAPEVLNHEGHDFLVDNWAIGVIVFTFLTGKPPFEEKEVENTLKNIQHNRYSFPDNCAISPEACDFIRQVLVANPERRMTMMDMLDHPFLQNETLTIPRTLHTSTLALPPTTSYLRKLQPIQEIQASTKYNVSQLQTSTNNRCGSMTVKATTLGQQYAAGFSESHANQENEVHQLLRARSQEAILTSSTAATAISSSASNQFQGYFNTLHQKKEAQLFQQDKIRPPSMPLKQLSSNMIPCVHFPSVDKAASSKPTTALLPSSTKFQLTQLEQQNQQPLQQQSQHPLPKQNTKENETEPTISIHSLVNVKEYIDHSDKFGLAYILNNGNIGVSLNDGNIVQILEYPDGEVFECISKSASSSNGSHKINRFPIRAVPNELMQQLFLARNAKDHFAKRHKDMLLKEQSIHQLSKDIFIKKFIINRQASFFRFSNKDLQVIFADKSEVSITQIDKLLIFKDKNANVAVYSLKTPPKNDLPHDIRKRINFIKSTFLSGQQQQQVTTPLQQQLPQPINLMTQSSTALSPPNALRFPSPLTIDRTIFKQPSETAISSSSLKTTAETEMIQSTTALKKSTNPMNSGNFFYDQAATHSAASATLLLESQSSPNLHLGGFNQNHHNLQTLSQTMRQTQQLLQQSQRLRMAADTYQSPIQRNAYLTQSHQVNPMKCHYK